MAPSAVKSGRESPRTACPSIHGGMLVNIVCLLDQGFEDLEFQNPYDQFRAAGSSPARGFQRGRT